jgi:hypothetical protein
MPLEFKKGYFTGDLESSIVHEALEEKKTYPRVEPTEDSIREWEKGYRKYLDRVRRGFSRFEHKIRSLPGEIREMITSFLYDGNKCDLHFLKSPL